MTNWSQLEKRIKEVNREKVTEVDFDLVIRDQIATGMAMVDGGKDIMYQCMQEYKKKEELKAEGYRLNYYREDGVVHAEIDEDFEHIRKQRWSK